MRIAATLLILAGMAQPLVAADPYRDPKAPLEQRVDDLVSQLTLDEKIGMLGQVQPAIPQSVGLGETWDPEILRQAGAVEGYEARVYYKKYDGARVGLAIRAPNVD